MKVRDVSLFTRGSICRLFLLTVSLILSGCSSDSDSNSEQTPTADVTAPTITLIGSATVNLNINDNYVELGATATDDTDGTVTVNITGFVISSSIGDYIISYIATDAAGNEAVIERTIIVRDLEAPVITLNGNAEINHNYGDIYEDLGATVTDNLDNDITLTTTGNVNVDLIGTYTITYLTTDTSGNSSTETRTVNVNDFEGPVITLNGDTEVNHNYGDIYEDLGATATDNLDTDITLTNTGSVNSDLIGTYTITYSATDTAGNSTTETRTIYVDDFKGPVITLNGETTVTVGYGRLYEELGATAVDNVDGDVNVAEPTGTVDVDSVGEYILEYSAQDSNNNQTTIQRTINVVEQRPLIITVTTIYDGGSVTINAADTATYTYDYTVDWGDGTVTENQMDDSKHYYTTAGTYTVSISGDLPRTKFLATTKLTSIEQWGDIIWQSMLITFQGVSDLTYNATDTPNLKNVNNISGMFMDTNINFSVDNNSIGDWDVSAVTSMETTFGGTDFNQDISNWDVSAVTNMKYVFSSSDFNQDIGNWDVSAVTDMYYMFNNTPFNQNIGNWDVSNVTNMQSIFSDTLFNQNVGEWDVSAVTNMVGMFHNGALSTDNYDALLIGWSQLELQNNIRIDVGTSIYSSDAQAARDILIDEFSWKIDDGGIEP